jgi:hypothetical protein
MQGNCIGGGGMHYSRRRLLTVAIGVAGVVATESVLLATANAQRSPQPIPSPHAPNPNYPPGLDGAGLGSDPDKLSIDPKKQQEIRDDIQKLYDLAFELRQQVGTSDLNATLPVTIVKKAQQIEKLAKHIKELSKG